MRRSYSTLGLMGMATLLCANVLVGCCGGRGGRGGAPCPERIVLKEKEIVSAPSSISAVTTTSPTSTIIVEEFIYTADDPLAGLNGGTGWAGPWSDPSSEFDITAPGLTHPAQISDTTVSGNNKASGILPDGGAPRTTAGTATRNISTASLVLINNALNYFNTGPLNPGGLWFRVLMSIPSSPGTGTPTFALNLNGVPAKVSMTTNGYTFTFGGGTTSETRTITPDLTYMFVGNIRLTNAPSSTFTATLWILDPTTNTFSLSAPSISIGSPGIFGPVPISITNANAQIMDASNDNFDEIYVASSPQGLNISVSP